MSRDLRWRIVVLQVALMVIFAFGAGIGAWAHNFTHDQVASQLSGQQISFPAANSAPIKALFAADARAMTLSASQTITTGDEAHVYAEKFTAMHPGLIGHGKTYDYFRGKSIVEATTNPKVSAADEATALTLFRGDTLRALLDQAWAFWFIGDIALYACIGLIAAALVVVVSLLFEVVVAPRRLAALPLLAAAA